MADSMTTHGRTTIYYRDEGLRLLGEVSAVESFQSVIRFNGRGAWRIVVSRDFYDTAARGIYVRRRVGGVSSYYTSGPITGFRRSKRGDADTMELWGHDETGWLWRRWVSPQPLDYPPFASAAYAIYTDIAAKVVARLIRDNIGPGARADRRLPSLVVSAFGWTGGTTVTSRGRFQVLGDLAAEMAVAGGIGFRLVQVPSDPPTLTLEIILPSDLSNASMFSEGLGTLGDFEHFGESYTNAVLVGGGGEGTARSLLEMYNPNGMQAWGRDERFVDQRHTTDINEMAQAGGAELSEAAGGRVGVSFTVHDTEGVQFGRDYALGDKVRVATDVGTIIDLVREVTLTLDAAGTEDVSVLVGTAASTAPQVPKTLQELQRVQRQIRNLEVR